MKDQFFADQRDLLKYDLLLELLGETPSLERLTFLSEGTGATAARGTPPAL